ncbi:hypothetical protein ZIOFF_056203 [Zingiber officinale]|uniref:Uncharacterized protein n=1 Tax=Zingiber officinale TaxID=94328 RepID=A0A8J5FLS4_ZINOF|nr:hypothetical protein ZIOFF_056203 [Zingiber officinale]
MIWEWTSAVKLVGGELSDGIGLLLGMEWPMAGRGEISNPDRRNTAATQRQTEPEGDDEFRKSYPLYSTYCQLANDTCGSILLKEHHDKHKEMADIERKAINQLFITLREVELIIQTKEYDYTHHAHNEGREADWHQQLQAIKDAKKQLWEDSLCLRETTRQILEHPP